MYAQNNRLHARNLSLPIHHGYRNMRRPEGHASGFAQLKECLKWCLDLGIHVVSVSPSASHPTSLTRTSRSLCFIPSHSTSSRLDFLCTEGGTAAHSTWLYSYDCHAVAFLLIGPQPQRQSADISLQTSQPLIVDHPLRSGAALVASNF